MVESFVQDGENPDWSDQPPQQNPPGWRPTWRPKKQRKRRKAAQQEQGYPQPYPQPYQAPYQQPVYPAPAQQYVPQQPPMPAPVQSASQAYPYQAKRLPQTYAAPEDEQEYYPEPVAVPDAPENLGRPDPLRLSNPYPNVPSMQDAADRSIVRPNRNFLDHWRGYGVIKTAPNINELSQETARVPLRQVDFLQRTRDRARVSAQNAQQRIATYQATMRNNRLI